MVILKLIKYHDKYLNEGELTYDNLSFLAQELENKRELFDMIIEVKTADNRAKSIAVYNKFLGVIPKYVEFKNIYFSSIEPGHEEIMRKKAEFDYEIKEGDDDILLNAEEELIITPKSKIQPKEEKKIKINNKSEIKEITKEDFEQIYQNILHGTDLEYYYRPIIDIRNRALFGYELIVELENGADFSEVLRFAKEEGKFEKINQLLAVNLLEQGVKQKNNPNITLVVRFDLKSFIKYNNKKRIYDIADKDNILILFENYDYSNITDINEICKEIKRNRGTVGFADYQKSTLTLKEISNMDIDFIEYNYDRNDDKIQQLVEYCSSNTQKIWISNITNKETVVNMKKLNAQFLCGDCIFGKNERPETTDYEVEQFIDLI